MNLPFTRFVGGKPTYFPEKIIAGLYEKKLITFSEGVKLIEDYIEFEHEDLVFSDLTSPAHKGISKLHTFRPNDKGRWKAGVNIHFMFWTGRPYHSSPFVFAPIIPVVSVQKVEIKYIGMTNPHQRRPWVRVDGRTIFGIDGFDDGGTMLHLAHSDGFASTDDFFTWFNKDFSGSIIHWTDLKY